MALADPVQLYAAGSLKDALTDVAKAFEAKTGGKVRDEVRAVRRAQERDRRRRPRLSVFPTSSCRRSDRRF